MKDRLKKLLDHFKVNENGKKDQVLELMAGCGRNAALLHRYFHKVHMVEAVEKNLKWWPGYVKAYN